jgi:hypothetical protein
LAAELPLYARPDRLDPPPPAPTTPTTAALSQVSPGRLPFFSRPPRASIDARRETTCSSRACMVTWPRWPMRPGPPGPLLPLLSFYFSSPPPTWKYPWAGPKRNPRAAQRFPALFCSF